ncbi:hypothetical protein LshimejAT787_0312110 [Lyophyllum shimeji]|uniref:Uncharacterized protein n=1 Tax=Lyophyllum shimeji TaxID=47721 RepID=A0A9P3UJF8_LYOSH|nr:hypothetical protein LshimejAT787_0312110 [Lyophyllum shimeji]
MHAYPVLWRSWYAAIKATHMAGPSKECIDISSSQDELCTILALPIAEIAPVCIQISPAVQSTAGRPTLSPRTRSHTQAVL